jgi:hypothetical protein
MLALTLIFASAAWAQSQQSGPPPSQAPRSYFPPDQYPQSNPPPDQGQWDQGPNQGWQGPADQSQWQSAPIPLWLTIKAGTFVTVRTNGWLSSDKNQQGDAFFAALSQPLVVNGIVVAQRGQTVGGRIAEAQKAGRPGGAGGASRLGLELTSLTLVDGAQVSIRSAWITRTGPGSGDRSAAAIGTTTALGATIGGAASGTGEGFGIGAAAGAAAGVIGVLATRGRPTVVYPESLLTFRIEDPVTVSTTQAPQAFQYVGQGDYERSMSYGGQGGQEGPPPYQGQGGQEGAPPSQGPACAGYNCAPPRPPVYYGYYGPWSYPYYPYYPYYWGPGFAFYFGGPHYYGHGWYGGGHGGYHGGSHGGHH